MATKPIAAKVTAPKLGPTLPATKRQPSFDPKSFLARIGDGRSIGKYGKGQVVFSQGDAANAVFYIQKGKAKLTVVSEQGREAVIAILGTDDFFGEGCLAGQPKRIATVTAMTDSVIVRLEKTAIIRVLHEEPAFSEKFIAHLLGRSIRVESGSRRSAVQLERKAPGPPAAVVGEFRQGRGARARDSENQPGDARGNDRNDALARELLHE
jgi:CRP-like cAMP-binding protein